MWKILVVFANKISGPELYFFFSKKNEAISCENKKILHGSLNLKTPLNMSITNEFRDVF